MKNFNYKKLTLNLFIIFFLFCGLFCFIPNKSVEAEEQFPDYFSIIHTAGDNNYNINPNEGVAYVTPSDTVTARLYIDKSKDSTREIKQIMHNVYLNGVAISSAMQDEYNIKVEYNFNQFVLTSKFNEGEKLAPYGKYEISLRYFIDEGQGQVEKSLSSTYYVVRDGDYYSSTNVNSQFDNCFKVEKQNISNLYDRIYQYNYSIESLPTLTFNKKNINVTIIKTFQKLSYSQTIWFDGINVVSEGDNIVYITSDEDSYVSIIFNDLGKYEIKYNFTYCYNNQVSNLQKSESLHTSLKHCDVLEIFGYQAYYSDSQTSELKEFKNIQNGIIQSQRTDVSYAVKNIISFNGSLKDKQTASRNTILEEINNNNITIQKTNQAPVQFKYDVEIFNSDNSSNLDTQSGYWKLKYNTNLNKYDFVQTQDEAPIKTDYDNRPISESGIYLINLIYKFHPSVLGSDSDCASSPISQDSGTSSQEKLRSQWFLFEITKDTTKMLIQTKEDEPKTLNDEAFTSCDVEIQKQEDSLSIFNAQTKLVVYMQENYVGEYVEVATIETNDTFTATKNGKYIVTMYFGKNLKRSYSSTFTIDKNPIENVQIFALNNYTGSTYYYRNEQIEFFTNQEVIVSWNEKASGCITKAEYKFIPIVESKVDYDNALLSQYFKAENYYSIPADYVYDFNNTANELKPIPYQNTQSLSNEIQSTYVLSQSGMYIFKITDNAGHEVYVVFVIDKTPSKILQRVDGVFTEPSEQNTVSSDVEVVWGQYKVTQFKNINYAAGKYNINDEWVNEVFNNSETLASHFKMLSINTINKYFVTSRISNTVRYLVNGSSYNPTTKQEYVLHDAFLSQIKFIDEDNEVANENQYIFYVLDEINTKVYDGMPRDSIENYETNYTSKHMLTLSSDSSKSELYYKNLGKNTQLLQYNFFTSSIEDVDGEEYSKKDKYYIPTTKNTLVDSNEILFYSFNPTPEAGVLEVGEVYYKFSPFVETKRTDAKNNIAYTYSFFDYESDSSKTIIYSKLNPEKNLATQSYDEFGNIIYTWEINKEYNEITGNFQTRAGKYTITRIYENLSNTQNKINDTKDYMIRTFTFVVDRNGIISTPVITEDDSTTLYSYIGDAIKLQALEDEDTKMYFEDIFLAMSNSSDKPIFETNKLPVYVFIPEYKYGYTFVDGGEFKTEDSIIYYSQNNLSSKIDSYKLSVQIKYATELSGVDQSKVIYNSLEGITDAGYLKFYESELSGRTFTKVGYYKVIIKQGSQNYGKNEFSFVFRITKGTPEFTINKTSNNEELAMYNQIYYTNQDVVRLTWEDSSNKFMSIINKSEIYYSVNNGKKVKIDSSLIKTVDRVNTIDLNLKSIGAFSHGTQIDISMQFEGNEKDYNEGDFRTTKSIIIDTVAPKTNINRLVVANNVENNNTRNIQDKYNTTTQDGLYKFYSYIIDVKDIKTLFDFSSHKDGETNQMYYRVFETKDHETTKYNNIYVQETKPSEIENSTSNFSSITSNLALNELINNSSLVNKYVEIVEIDLAGNITIYTIYITDVSKISTETAISYQKNKNVETLTFENLKNNIDIFAKSLFKLNEVKLTNFAWSRIIVNNVTYLKTPYSEGYYYNVDNYDELNPAKSITDIEEFGLLLPNIQKQKIKFDFVPGFANNSSQVNLSVSVLNSTLSVMHTSTIKAYENQEGILIKIPNNFSTNDAIIYAKEVEILQYVKNGTDYIEEQLYFIHSDTYFTDATQKFVNKNFVTSSYVTYMGSTYIKIVITSPETNRFYKYMVFDNFDDSYPFTNIYGSEIIENELSSTVKIVENYENTKLYHYSTQDTYFKFNSAKDKIKLTITTQYTSVVFNLPQDATLFKKSGYGELYNPTSKTSVVYTIKMFAPQQNMAENIAGSEINFTIEKFIAVESISNGYSYDTINLVLYNTIPNITLYDTMNKSENELFNKNTMYGNEIKITFKQTTGRIPCLVYLQTEDGTIEQISSGKTVSQPQTYTLIIKYTQIFLDDMYNTKLNFTISNNEEDFYKVVYTKNGQTVFATPTGNSFTYEDKDNNKSISIETHFILNTNDFHILYNTDQGITKIDNDPVYHETGFTTYIFNLTNDVSQTASAKFNRTIAITVIPETTDILKNYSYYEVDATIKSMIDNDNESTQTSNSFVVTNEESNVNYKRISWQSYYGIKENLVTATIYFGDNETIYKPKSTTENNTTSINLTSSGTYYLTFTDIAGNVHMFNGVTSTYTIRYLKSVIYTVNGSSPINNAIYDSEVVVNVPKSTQSYYNSNAQPKLYALLNGKQYVPQISRDNRTYTFSEAGLYKIWFTASVTDSKTKEVKQINEEPLYFLIIRPNETRWAFDFSEFGDYYVKSIIKNDEDVTESLTNVNVGNLTYRTEKIGNEFVQKPYLKNFLISINDALTGRGRYTVTIATDNEFKQEFTYSFWINNTNPRISVSEEENTKTTKDIIVTFNTVDLLEDVGDCVLKITGYTDLVMNEELLSEGQIKDVYSITLNSNTTYYIQLFSESGKLLYSYRVTKQEPLNTVAIILIVVSVVVAAGLTVMFILLRKKMKIR